MVDATDVLQTLAVSLQLAYGLGKSLYDYKDDKKGIFMRLKWDLYLIEKIQQSYNQQLVDTANWSGEDRQMFDETMIYLQKLTGDLQEIRNSLNNDRPQLMGSATWFHFGPRYEKIATELSQWTKRFDFHLLFMPRMIRAAVDLGTQEARELAPCLVSQRKIEAFQALPNAAQNIQQQDMLIPDYITRLGGRDGGLPDKHTFAKLDNESVILDYKPYQHTIPSEQQAFIGRLCAVLNSCDPGCSGVLKAVGYFDQSDYRPQPSSQPEPRIGIIYFVPKGVIVEGRRPYSLSQLLNWSSQPGGPTLPPKHPLDQRFELARKLSIGLLFLHAVGWVHKSIRPSNILVFQSVTDRDKGKPPEFLGDPYLVGMENTRSNEAGTDETVWSRKEKWFSNIYQHPLRMFNETSPNRRYTMAHDVYSLGVVLLEIGLWRPVTSLERKFQKPGPTQNTFNYLNAEDCRKKLIDLAQRDVAITMGRCYAGIVETCLKMGDDVRSDHRYIQSIFNRLDVLSSAIGNTL